MKLGPRCERCGWKYPGFHICVDLSTPCPGEFQMKAPKRKVVGHPVTTQAHRDALARGRANSWAKYREANAERDAKIVETYKQGIGLYLLSKEFGISYTTAQKIVSRAAERGEVVMRPKHVRTKKSITTM